MTIKGPRAVHEEITLLAAKRTPYSDRERLVNEAKVILALLSAAGYSQREGICILGWAKWYLIEQMLDE